MNTIEKHSELATLCYEAAKSNGWHERERPTMELLALVVGEFSEAVEALRGDKTPEEQIANVRQYFRDAYQLLGFRFEEGSFVHFVRGTFVEELVDVIIRCYDAIGAMRKETAFENSILTIETTIELVPVSTTYEADRTALIEQIGKIIESDHKPIAKERFGFYAAHAYRILLYCGFYFQEIIDLIHFKLAYNKTRGKMHGKTA